MSRSRAICLALAVSVFCLGPRSGLAQQASGDIQAISLDSLLNIQVSGPSRYAQHMTRAPASITLITADEIERLGYRNLKDLFADTRGLYMTYDRNYFAVGVRGFSRPGDYGNRVSILINGHRINESVYGSAPNGSDLALDMRTIDRVEIIRGPGAALYGTGAMLAVVNIITKTNETTEGIHVSAETASFGRLGGSARYGRSFAGGLNVFVAGTWSDVDGQDLFFKEYDDPETNNGVAEGLDSEKTYGLLTTAAYRGLTFQSFFSSRRKGFPTGSFGTAFNDDRAETLDEFNFVELKADRTIGFDKSITLRGHYNFYNYEGAYPYDLEDYNTLLSETSDGRGLGVEGQFRWDHEASNRFIAGVEYIDHRRADYRSKDQFEDLFSRDFPFHTFSLYVQDEYQIMRDMAITFGIRRDENSKVGSSTNPRLAIVYHATRSSTAKLLYGEAFRAPNVYEVGYESLSGDEAKGNPDLKPEKIRTFELAWEQRLTPVLWGTVSAYRYGMDGLIDQEVDPLDELLQFRNTGEVEARGIELELRARFDRGFGGTAGYAFQRAEDGDTGAKLTNSPRHVGKISVYSPLGDRLQVGIRGRYESERLTVYDTRSDSFFLTSLHLRSHPPILLGVPRNGRRTALSLSLLVDNLFDVDYGTPGGLEHLQSVIPQDGRTIVLRLEAQI